MDHPTQKELKERFGDKIPDEPIPIQEVSALPLKNDGCKNVFIGILEKFEVWKKTTVAGAVLSILLILRGVIGFVADTVDFTITSANNFAPLYEEIKPFIGEMGEQLVVFFNEPAPGSDEKWPTQFGTLTSGTSAIPISGAWGIDLKKYG